MTYKCCDQHFLLHGVGSGKIADQRYCLVLYIASCASYNSAQVSHTVPIYLYASHPSSYQIISRVYCRFSLAVFSQYRLVHFHIGMAATIMVSSCSFAPSRMTDLFLLYFIWSYPSWVLRLRDSDSPSMEFGHLMRDIGFLPFTCFSRTALVGIPVGARGAHQVAAQSLRVEEP